MSGIEIIYKTEYNELDGEYAVACVLQSDYETLKKQYSDEVRSLVDLDNDRLKKISELTQANSRLVEAFIKLHMESNLDIFDERRCRVLAQEALKELEIK